MSFDAEIDIFGKVSNPEAIWDLANEVAAIDTRFNFTPAEEAKAQFMRDLIKAGEKGAPIQVRGSDMKDVFEDLKAVCWDANLSYVIWYSDGGDDFTRGLAWRPFNEELEFFWDGDNAAVSTALVRKASDKGPEAVVALLDHVDAFTSVGKIEIEPGFAKAFLAFRHGEGLDQDRDEAASAQP